MRKGRIDYRMARRATLRDVRAGLRSPQDVCDAHPDLVRAGRNIGTDVDEQCPICEDGELRHVTYIFTARGPRTQSGRAIPRDSLPRQLERYGDLSVYTVEVCPSCAWHHLIESFWLLPKAEAG